MVRVHGAGCEVWGVGVGGCKVGGRVLGAGGVGFGGWGIWCGGVGYGERPFHQIVSMMKWIRISRLSMKNSLSLCVGREWGDGGWRADTARYCSTRACQGVGRSHCAAHIFVVKHSVNI